MKLSEIVEPIGCPKASASEIRRGKRTPHVSASAAPARLAGIVRTSAIIDLTSVWAGPFFGQSSCLKEHFIGGSMESLSNLRRRAMTSSGRASALTTITGLEHRVTLGE